MTEDVRSTTTQKWYADCPLKSPRPAKQNRTRLGGPLSHPLSHVVYLTSASAPAEGFQPHLRKQICFYPCDRKDAIKSFGTALGHGKLTCANARMLEEHVYVVCRLLEV